MKGNAPIWEDPPPEDPSRFEFCLYVAGMTSRSQNAIRRMKLICEAHLPGRYSLEIIDIYQQPILARAAQIIAVPTLVRKFPTPVRKFIGDISKKDSVLISIGISAQEGSG